MAERIAFSWIYDRSPLEIFRMVTRLDHLEEKARALGHLNHAVLELRDRGGVFRSVATRQVDAQLPVWAPRWLKPRNMITQTQLWQPPTWDGSRRYDATVEITGIPVVARGEGRLTALEWGDRTRYEIVLDVVATRRMLAAKLEGFIAEKLVEGIEGEHAFRLQWLARAGPRPTLGFG